MAIQTIPTTDQAVDYLTATAAIPLREMSRPMYQLLNSCARVVQRNYPGMIGYYDPADDCKRLDLSKHLHWVTRITDVIPQSPKLQAKTAPVYPDPFASVISQLLA
jgi:hypothetical protein